MGLPDPESRMLRCVPFDARHLYKPVDRIARQAQRAACLPHKPRQSQTKLDRGKAGPGRENALLDPDLGRLHDLRRRAAHAGRQGSGRHRGRDADFGHALQARHQGVSFNSM